MGLQQIVERAEEAEEKEEKKEQARDRPSTGGGPTYDVHVGSEELAEIHENDFAQHNYTESLTFFIDVQAQTVAEKRKVATALLANASKFLQQYNEEHGTDLALSDLDADEVPDYIPDEEEDEEAEAEGEEETEEAGEEAESDDDEDADAESWEEDDDGFLSDEDEGGDEE